MRDNIKMKNGFTLVEMMIVVAILGLLVALGVPGYVKSRNIARANACLTNLRMIENAADQYRIDASLTLSDDTNIELFWPASSGVKDVSSYINKQLFCPTGGFYHGGDNSTATYTNDVRSDTEIKANGFPHCCTTAGGTGITNLNTQFEHSIESKNS